MDKNTLIFAIVFAAYELFVRLYPTSINLSLLDNIKTVMNGIHNLIEIIIPNRKNEKN